MTRVCSFLPAVTQMLYDMGLQRHLYGVTFECPKEARREKPAIVRCVLEGKHLSSQEIEALFSASKHQGKSLYYVDEPLLEEIAPDIIFTQDICDVCQIDTECTAIAVAKLEKSPKIVSISPESLENVFENAMTIATVLGKEDIAYDYVAKLRSRIAKVAGRLKAARAMTKRVMLMEWMEPIYNCGHWIPHQICYAGGVDMLANPSGNSIRISWDRLRAYDPEIIVIAPCGFTVERTLEEITVLREREGWEALTAVRNNTVFVADFELFTQSSAATLVEGIELLAGLFHPEIITIPNGLKNKFRRLDNQKKVRFTNA